MRERAFFFGTGRQKLFGCLHVPPGEPVGGLVVCCPLQAELLRNYRREVLLARRLASEGIAVQRFHYRGAGHSDGDTGAMTLQGMQEDALAAAEELVRKTGVSAVGFMGARWGGLVAAGAAATKGAALALWEPVIDTERYFDEILRFRLMYELKQDPATSISHDDLVAELLDVGSVDVLGHTLERTLYASAVSQTLDGVLGARASAALFVQVGVGRALRKECASLIDSWRARGLDVDAHVVSDRETWWLSGDLWPVHETHAPTKKLIEITADWVTRTLGKGGRP